MTSLTWNRVDEDDIQDYLGRGVVLLPNVYEVFLEKLMDKERERKLCLLPSTRLQLYHIRLERKVQTRINAHRTVA